MKLQIPFIFKGHLTRVAFYFKYFPVSFNLDIRSTGLNFTFCIQYITKSNMSFTNMFNQTQIVFKYLIAEITFNIFQAVLNTFNILIFDRLIIRRVLFKIKIIMVKSTRISFRVTFDITNFVGVISDSSIILFKTTFLRKIIFKSLSFVNWSTISTLFMFFQIMISFEDFITRITFVSFWFLVFVVELTWF